MLSLNFNQESEQGFFRSLLKVIDDFLKNYTKPNDRILGLMTAKQVKDELDISFKTLQRWESAGLKRYKPPVEDGKKVFYRVSDILIFLGVEDGR